MHGYGIALSLVGVATMDDGDAASNKIHEGVALADDALSRVVR